MSILDKYIFSKALAMWLAALFCLTGLVLLSMFFGKLAMFSEHDAGMFAVMAFMLLKVPEIVYMILPFSLCLGILSTQAAFSRHVETIAMQACAVSDKRIYMPYILLGVLASILMSGISFYGYPLAQKKVNRIEALDIRNKAVKGTFGVTGSRFQTGDAIYHVELMDVAGGLMRNVSAYRLKAGKLTGIIKAHTVTWDGENWYSPDMEIITLDTPRMDMRRSAGTLPLHISPEDLASIEPTPDVLTIAELEQYLQKLKQDGIRSKNLETYFHSRISVVAAPLIMTLLVLPFGMRFPRTGGIARGIAVGLVLGLIYWGLQTAAAQLGQSGYARPVLASWSINILALITGMVLIISRRGTYG